MGVLRSKFILIFSLIGIIAIIILSNNDEKMINSNFCDQEEDIKKGRLEGIVIKKYIDKKNHSARKLLIHNKGNEQVVLILNNDNSHLFEFAAINDSLFKKEHSVKVEIKRKSEKWFFKVDFGCKK